MGKIIRHRLLLIGEFDNKSRTFLDEISEWLVQYDSFADLTCNPIQCQNGQEELRFDVIIIASEESVYPVSILKNLYEENLNSNGVITLLEKNDQSVKGAISNLARFTRQILSISRQSQLQSNFSEAHILHIPSATSNGQIYESFSPQSYKSNKNSFLIKEKLRGWLLNSFFSDYFYAKNIWIINKNGKDNSLLHEIKKEFKLEHNSESGELQWSVIYYKHGKLILSFVNKQNPDGSKYAVVAFSVHAVEQRDTELSGINLLSKNRELKHFFNGVIEKKNICDLSCYLMNENRGLTVDADNSNIELMTKNAYLALVKLTKATATENLDHRIFSCLLDSYFEKIIRRTVKYEKQLTYVKLFLDEQIEISRLSHVCVHGDLKLENFVLNKEYEVAGIIDWELFEPKGFLLIDLLYLITYNRTVLVHEHFSETFMSLLENRMTKQESEMLDGYCLEMNILKADRELLILVAFIHHYAMRCLVDINKSIDMQQFELCLDRTIKYIKDRENQ